VRAEGALFDGQSVVVMAAGPLLSRKQPAEWANALERKVNRLARRTEDVKHLYAGIQKSPSPEKTGAIVLEHIGDYDDDFFEALAGMIAMTRHVVASAGPATSKRSGSTCSWCAGAPAMARRPLCGQSSPKARHTRELQS
jgi:hypothetical protein